MTVSLRPATAGELPDLAGLEVEAGRLFTSVLLHEVQEDPSTQGAGIQPG